jgi:hypothetical protein
MPIAAALCWAMKSAYALASGTRAHRTYAAQWIALPSVRRRHANVALGIKKASWSEQQGRSVR